MTSSFLNKKETIILLATISALGIIITLLTSYNPLRVDDLLYQYFCTEDNTVGGYHYDHGNRIDNLFEAICSMCNWYFVENGRIVVNLITQCFCGFIGKNTFNIVNGFIYCLFIINCLIFLRINNIWEAILIICILWLCIPIQFSFTFSISHAINYLWGSTIFILFLNLLHYLQEQNLLIKDTIWSYSFLFVLGVITGNFHEGFSLPLSAGVFLFTLINYHHMSKQSIFLIIGLWIGTATVVFAPGTWHRRDMLISENSIEDVLLLKLQILFYSKRILFLIFLLIIYYFSQGKEWFKPFVKNNSITLSTIFIGIIFISLVPFFAQRMVFPYELLALLLSISLIRESHLWKTYKKHFCMIALLITTIHIPITFFYSKKVSNDYKTMIQKYIQSDDGRITHKDLYVPKIVFSYIKKPDLFEYEMISFEYGKQMTVEE